MEGGAGDITVKSGALRDLDLSIGVGELDITARLEGSCKLDLGIGETKLKLLGTADDYCIEVSKGLGSINVDGTDVKNNTTIGNGKHMIKLNSGVGNIDVLFINQANS